MNPNIIIDMTVTNSASACYYWCKWILKWVISIKSKQDTVMKSLLASHHCTCITIQYDLQQAQSSIQENITLLDIRICAFCIKGGSSSQSGPRNEEKNLCRPLDLWNLISILLTQIHKYFLKCVLYHISIYDDTFFFIRWYIYVIQIFDIHSLNYVLRFA